MDDTLLIWRFKRGSREALRQIYEKHHRDLLKLAMVLTGQANTADDIVHDVFVRFAESARWISLTGSLKAYLVVSTMNRVRSHRRNMRRRGARSLDDAAMVVSGLAGPDQWAIVSEQLEQLSHAMTQLPEEQAEVVALHVHGGMRFREIACWQNTSVSTVQGRYRYGIEKLRSILNGELSS